MMGRMRSVIFGIVTLCATAGSALSQGLDHAKAEGHVGERIDGYLGIVVHDPPDYVPPLVEDINSERRQNYADIANKQGVEVAVVAQIAGEKLIARAVSGEFVLGSDGVWRQK